MYKVFIDGHIGTTGLLIQSRLEQRNDIELLTVPEVDRKNSEIKREIMSAADAVILCLPDDAARESFKNAADNTRFVDASSAHRVDPRWVYGLPELQHGQRKAITNANATNLDLMVLHIFLKRGIRVRALVRTSPVNILNINFGGLIS